MADSGHPPAELHERLLICRTIKLNAGAHGGHRRCCLAQMQKNAQNKPQIARLILYVHTTLQVYCNLFLTFCHFDILFWEKSPQEFPQITQFYHDCMLCYVQKPEERSSLCTGPIFPPARNRFSVRWTCVAGIRSGGQRHSGCSSAFPERSPPGGSPSTKTLQAKLKSPRNAVFRGL